MSLWGYDPGKTGSLAHIDAENKTVILIPHGACFKGVVPFSEPSDTWYMLDWWLRPGDLMLTESLNVKFNHVLMRYYYATMEKVTSIGVSVRIVGPRQWQSMYKVPKGLTYGARKKFLIELER